MEKCIRGTKAIAYFLDPLLIGEIDAWSQLGTIDEPCLVETLRRNKVALKFSQKIEMDLALKEKLYTAFPRLKSYLNDLEIKREKDSSAFSHIRREFSENGIEFMLIKSDGSFPYESDNIDVLIKPRMLGKVSKLLAKAGYSEFPEIRERHKFLFRNMSAYEVLPLHIHTRVEWEGTQFIDSQDLWSRSRMSSHEGGICAPSPEDCILITVAHLFFENHEIKLADLFKIASMLRNHNLNWDYMLDHAKRLHWDDAFYLTMLLVNLVCEELCGRKMLPPSVISKMEEANHGYADLFPKVMKPFSSGYTLIEIPYNFAVLFFLRRVFCDSSSSFAARLRHATWVASNVFRERIIRSQY